MFCFQWNLKVYFVFIGFFGVAHNQHNVHFFTFWASSVFCRTFALILTCSCWRDLCHSSSQIHDLLVWRNADRFNLFDCCHLCLLLPLWVGIFGTMLCELQKWKDRLKLLFQVGSRIYIALLFDVIFLERCRQARWSLDGIVITDALTCKI